MIDNVYIRHWVQDTIESGHWATTDSMERTTAVILLSGVYGNKFERGEIVEQSEMPIDRGAWSGVPDATKWVDELRREEPSMGLIASEWAGLEHLRGIEREVLEEALKQSYEEPENTQAQELFGKTEQLEAEIKRLQELADYRLTLLTKMPSEWQWLTEDDIHDLFTANETVDDYGEFEAIACAVSAKLKEKNT